MKKIRLKIRLLLVNTQFSLPSGLSEGLGHHQCYGLVASTEADKFFFSYVWVLLMFVYLCTCFLPPRPSPPPSSKHTILQQHKSSLLLLKQHWFLFFLPLQQRSPPLTLRYWTSFFPTSTITALSPTIPPPASPHVNKVITSPTTRSPSGHLL